MTHSAISLGVGLGGGKAATSSGRLPSGGYENLRSVEFDGTDDYLQIGDASTTIQDSSSGAFSWSMWVKYSSGQPAFVMKDNVGDGSGSRCFGISSFGTNNIYFQTFISSTAYYATWTNGITAVGDGNWNHLVFVNGGTGGTKQIYFNGSSVTLTDSTVGTKSNTTSQLLSVGGGAYGGGVNYPIDGLIDEVAAWDSALTASNVTAIYNSGVPNDLGPDGLNLSPVGYWRMGDINGGSGTSIANQGGGGDSIDGTLVNGPTYSTDIPS